MLEKRGISIYAKHQPVPQSLIDTYDGTYLVPSAVQHTHFYGNSLTITADTTDGKGHRPVAADLKYEDGAFLAENGERYFFREIDGNKYLMHEMRGRTIPAAMKAKDFTPLPEAWMGRMGKRYLVVDQTEQDMVSHELMTGFTVGALPGFTGVAVLAFSSLEDADIYGHFESCVIPVDDQSGRGFLLTPSNGSRDLTDPYFYVRDGVEYCYAASYLYRDADTLPVYRGETFAELPEDRQLNAVYQLTEPLKKLPEVPAGHRLMVLNKEMDPVWDSQVEKEYKEVKEGFISFI